MNYLVKKKTSQMQQRMAAQELLFSLQMTVSVRTFFFPPVQNVYFNSLYDVHCGLCSSLHNHRQPTGSPYCKPKVNIL